MNYSKNIHQVETKKTINKMNWFKKIFTNDWISVEVMSSEYDTWYQNSQGFKVSKTRKEITTYHIQYSKVRNKFRMKIEGWDCNATRNVKLKATNRIVELNKLLLKNKVVDIL